MLEGTLDRIWDSLENRYAPDDDGCGCGCDAPPEAIAVLQNSNLTEHDLVSYLEGKVTFDELIARVDADVNDEAINDLGSLAEALQQPADGSDPRAATDCP